MPSLLSPSIPWVRLPLCPSIVLGYFEVRLDSFGGWPLYFVPDRIWALKGTVKIGGMRLMMPLDGRSPWL
jgi:hypothetical protein